MTHSVLLHPTGTYLTLKPKFFGISTNGFRIVGGVIIFKVGFDMLQARYTYYEIGRASCRERV